MTLRIIRALTNQVHNGVLSGLPYMVAGSRLVNRFVRPVLNLLAIGFAQSRERERRLRPSTPPADVLKGFHLSIDLTDRVGDTRDRSGQR